VSPYASAAIGLLGTLIGGTVAGYVSLRVARQARAAAERSWVRDNRRELYDRLLTSAQQLLIACEEDDGEAVEVAYRSFFEAYGVVQTVAQRPVVDACRIYAYRLLELVELSRRRRGLESRSRLGPARFGQVAQLVRRARHGAIDAMRGDLGLDGSARPPDSFNPFAGTELEAEYGGDPYTRRA
jgi:hypothetical protein